MTLALLFFLFSSGLEKVSIRESYPVARWVQTARVSASSDVTPRPRTNRSQGSSSPHTMTTTSY
jgi:hypothetical protein